MKTLPKILIGVLGCAVLCGALAAGGAWWLWHRFGDRLVGAGKEAMETGRREGAELDETGCMAAAIERHRNDWRISLASSIPNNLRLSACLEASVVSDGFCDGVPSNDNVLQLAVWVAGRCNSLGFSDPYCNQLFQQVANYCSSPKRGAKLKGHGSVG